MKEINSIYYIYINNIRITSSDNLYFYNLSEENHQTFQTLLIKQPNLKVNRDIIIREEDIIDISFYINNICIYELSGYILENEVNLKKENPFLLLMKTTDFPALTVSTILKEWADGNEIFYWKDNRCKEAKSLWLTSCLYWQQLFPKNKQTSIDVNLNLDNVNNYLDFFCMLGEAFWGRKGYIGRDFHGFDDQLSELHAKMNIYIKDEKKLKLFLERISPCSYNYYDVFIEILLKNNCNIIKIN